METGGGAVAATRLQKALVLCCLIRYILLLWTTFVSLVGQNVMNVSEVPPRWLILGEDGRHVTIGRVSAPSEDEILAAEKAMTSQGVSGWLVLLTGEYYCRTKPQVTMLRSLRTPMRPFEAALADFEIKRSDLVPA